jgi:hypothetical protein
VLFRSFVFAAAPRPGGLTALLLKAHGGSARRPTSYLRVGYQGGRVTVASTADGAAFRTHATFAARFVRGDRFSATVDEAGTVRIFRTHAGTTTCIGTVMVARPGVVSGGGQVGFQLPAGGRIDTFAGGTVP